MVQALIVIPVKRLIQRCACRPVTMLVINDVLADGGAMVKMVFSDIPLRSGSGVPAAHQAPAYPQRPWKFWCTLHRL